MKLKQTLWLPQERLILTELSGDVDLTDIQDWKRSITDAFALIENNSRFKIMVNLHGFKAVDVTAHKAFREIIPRVLANYGWRVGYLDLFPEAVVDLKNERGIQCVAAVHVHHDETKINNYDTNYSREHERFFTDPVKAREWISSIRLS